MSSPKNCLDCREWFKSQTDEASRCTLCCRIIRITAKRKISHHKKTGPWAPVTECTRCEQGEEPPKSVSEEPRPKKKRRKKGTFHKLPIHSDALPRDLDTDLRHYQEPVFTRGVGLETRQKHIEHHLEGSPHSLTTMQAVRAAGATLDEPKSWTSLANGTADINELFANLAAFTQAVDDDYIREYRSGGQIIRLTFTGDHDGLEKTVLQEQPDGTCQLVTSHDKFTLADVKGRLKSGSWR